MSKEKLTPVEWLLNELDQRDMIDKIIYHEKDRTFDSISEQALNMEKEYASQSKWISVDGIEGLKRIIEIHIETTGNCVENFNIDATTKELLNQDNKLFKIIIDTLSNILETHPTPTE